MVKEFLPLFPTYADPDKWRIVRPIPQDKEKWQKMRLKVLMRDEYTCQYCGHRSEKYQIVHHVDEDPANDSEDNLAVICQLCNVVMHAGMGCVLQGVVDLYARSKATQREIVQTIWKMRFGERKPDEEIISHLGLSYEVPFVEDKEYLRKLFAFVTSRQGKPGDMYENWRSWQVGRQV